MGRIPATKKVKKIGNKFKPEDHPCPDDFNAKYFPNMPVGNTVHDSEEAQQLLMSLLQLPSLTQPLLTPAALQLMQQKTDPTPEDLREDELRHRKRAKSYRGRLHRQKERERKLAKKRRKVTDDGNSSESNDDGSEPSITDGSEGDLDAEAREEAAAAAEAIMGIEQEEPDVDMPPEEGYFDPNRGFIFVSN